MRDVAICRADATGSPLWRRGYNNVRGPLGPGELVRIVWVHGNEPVTDHPPELVEMVCLEQDEAGPVAAVTLLLAVRASGPLQG